MDYDVSEPISQGSDEAQEAENRRIAEIADELRRLCRVHEAQFGVGKSDVGAFETEQRAAEQLATMAASFLCFRRYCCTT